MEDLIRGTCQMCGNTAYHKVEEVLFEDDPTAFVELPFIDSATKLPIKCPARHPCTAYVCHKCFGKIMGPRHNKRAWWRRIFGK